MTPEEASDMVGKEVVYCPYPGSPVEVGVLTSVNAKWAFVRYHDGETAAATRFDHLFKPLETPTPPEPSLAELQEMSEHEGWDGSSKAAAQEALLTPVNSQGHAFVFRHGTGLSYAEQRAAWERA